MKRIIRQTSALLLIAYAMAYLAGLYLFGSPMPPRMFVVISIVPTVWIIVAMLGQYLIERLRG